MKIGLIGLGIMGKPMAKNILKKGYPDLLVSDLNKAAVDEVVACGAKAATNQEIGEQCDVVLTMLPNSPHVKSVMLTPETGVANFMHKGQVFIDMSSINPVASKEISAALAEKGVEMLDAPVSGGEPKAIDGTLTIMGAGDPAAFAAAEGVFSAISERVFQLGEIGNGKLIKAMTNLLGAINLAAVGEFYRFAQSAGLDMETLQQVVAVSAGGSTQFERNFNKMVADDYRPTFALALLRKDMSIALASAQSQGLSLPLSEEAFRLFKLAAAFDKEDCSAIAKVPAGA